MTVLTNEGTTHCPTCGAANDGTANGWQYRAQAAEDELSRANGEIDRCHVILTAAGATECPGASLGDRLGVYIGEVQTKLEQLTEARRERDAAHAHACENSIEERHLREERADHLVLLGRAYKLLTFMDHGESKTARDIKIALDAAGVVIE